MKGLLTSEGWRIGLGGLLSIIFLSSFFVTNICNAQGMMNGNAESSYQQQISPGARMMGGRLVHSTLPGGAAPGMGGLSPTGGYPLQGSASNMLEAAATFIEGAGGSMGGGASSLVGNERNGGVGSDYLKILDQSTNKQSAYTALSRQKRPHSTLRGGVAQIKLNDRCATVGPNQQACPGSIGKYGH